MASKIIHSRLVWLAVLFIGVGAGFWAVRVVFHGVARLTPLPASSASPLFEPNDRPMTVFIKVEDEAGSKLFNMASVIRQSKSRANQMKQAVLAFLGGPREGRLRVPVPEGLSLNEFYLTPAGSAVVDLSTAQVKREKVGFYQEALFVRGLIETLTGNFFEIKQVKILVDGQDQPTLFGHYALGTSEANMPVSTLSHGSPN